MPKKKYLMVVLALIFAIMQILPAFANELDDKQAEYDDVQQKMQQMEIAKERARREAEEASDRMEEIVAELNRLQTEIKEIEAKRESVLISSALRFAFRVDCGRQVWSDVAAMATLSASGW